MTELWLFSMLIQLSTSITVNADVKLLNIFIPISIPIIWVDSGLDGSRGNYSSVMHESRRSEILVKCKVQA